MPRWLRIVLLVVVIAAAIVVLFTTVFPWVESRLEDPTMGMADSAVAGGAEAEPSTHGAQVSRAPR
ncbi:MAG TPA: hypothetical protein VK906_03485 [Egicoccus sp.]|nr:hypothetical protein [Egicoccus sp.]HSK22207.1 hypothetical protein [Egicoccus sp.]